MDNSDTRPIVVFTGNCDTHGRHELKDMAEANGWRVAGSITSDVVYLVTTPEAEGFGKAKQARKLGIPIVHFERWFEIVETGELP